MYENFFSLSADRQRVCTDFQEVEITAMAVCDIAKWKLGEGGLMLGWEYYYVCVTVELVFSMYTAVHYSKHSELGSTKMTCPLLLFDTLYKVYRALSGGKCK
jgi:hypothetical protein